MDIVKRLRSFTENDAYANPFTFGTYVSEAADEIERLRTELTNAKFFILPPPKPVGHYKVEYMQLRINAPKKPRRFTRLMMRFCFQAIWVDVLKETE